MRLKTIAAGIPCYGSPAACNELELTDVENNIKAQTKQFFLQEAKDAIHLARVKAENDPPNAETLAEIEKLCATSEFKLSRALRECEDEREAREAATSLLTSHHGLTTT